LLEPTSSAAAALQLEGIGKEAIETLRKGLHSADPEVRFYSAEALAYLDDIESAPVLAESAARERAFRWHALTALSTMDHVAAFDALSELLNEDSAETRYGAFRAMQARNPRDPAVRGEILNESFAFHQLASSGEPIVHFARSRRPEIVLFGHDQQLTPPSFLLAGRRIMIKRHNDHELKVIRFEPGADDQVVVCPSRVDAMIRAIVELGGGYEEVYQAVRSAKVGGYLPSRLAVNSRARVGRVYHRGDDAVGEEEAGRFQAANPLPELFQDRLDREEDQGQQPEDVVADDDQPADEEGGWFDTMKGWFSPSADSE
jgi:hypothetical protein